jgi:hypothetical protein
MNISEIIDRLCAHELTRDEAKEKIQEIVDQYRQKGALEFEIMEVGFTSCNNHARIRIEKRYSWKDIEGKLKKGDKVDLIIRP